MKVQDKKEDKKVDMVNEKTISYDKLDRKWIDINIPCSEGCPIMTNIPGYIEAILKGDYKKSYLINRLDNVLPAVLGRVCNRPCESVCRHGWDGLGDSVAICFLKRSAADYGLEPVKLKITPNGKKVCVVGAGPSGLTAANDLAIKGYDVTILEQYDEPGGMLRYGIPQFRLPYDVVAGDVKSITDLGVTIKTGHRIENQQALDQLKKEYDAVILAGGCMAPKKSGMPGLENDGVFFGIDFMMAANREEMKPNLQNVVVIGGGFTAVDCARMSHRLGAKTVTLAYRRTKQDMYVGKEELEAIEAEGIKLAFLVSPLAIETENGKASGVKFIRNHIEKNRSLSQIEGSEFVMKADTVIFAIGQGTEEGITDNPDQEQNENLFICGDFRNGASTVIQAAADGRKTAQNVHKLLGGIEGYRDFVHIEPVTSTGRERDFDFIPRQHMDETPLHQRREKNTEVELGFSKEKSLTESKRCYLCHYNFQIDIHRCIYCLACIDVMPVNCIKMAKDIEVHEDGNITYVETKKWSETKAITIDNNQCIRCGNCVRACPVECISISKFTKETEEVK